MVAVVYSETWSRCDGVMDLFVEKRRGFIVLLLVGFSIGSRVSMVSRVRV